MNSDKWIPATNRYRVDGTFRVRVYSDTDMNDIIGAATEHACSHIVETFDEASAVRAAVEKQYQWLDTKGVEYETMGWKAPPSVTFMGVAKPAYKKEAQFSLFDFEPFVKA